MEAFLGVGVGDGEVEDLFVRDMRMEREFRGFEWADDFRDDGVVVEYGREGWEGLRGWN